MYPLNHLDWLDGLILFPTNQFSAGLTDVLSLFIVDLVPISNLTTPFCLFDSSTVVRVNRRRRPSLDDPTTIPPPESSLKHGFFVWGVQGG